MDMEKSIISERIKSMRKSKGYTQEQLAEILGLNAKSSIANYESGANAPSDDIKLKMCKLFNCTMDYLMGTSSISNPKEELENELCKFNLTEDEYSDAINCFMNDTINKNKILHLIDSNLNTPQVYLCPVYGKIKAGEPNWAEQNIEGRVLVPITPENTHPEDCFYLRVDGNSMNKVVKDRDYALIQKQDYAEDGDYVVALVNGYDATLKKYKRLNEQFVLLEPVSEDSSFETITVDLKTTEFKILGKMIAHFGFTK